MDAASFCSCYQSRRMDYTKTILRYSKATSRTTEIMYNATKDKIKSLYDRKVWNVVNLPKGQQPVKGRWVFAIWSGNHVKAHFIMKGITQIFGIDYEEMFSSVARFETIHLVLVLALLHDWKIKVLDVKTTFLFGELDEEIYMMQSEGFIVKG